MQQVERCDAIDVGEATVGIGPEVEAANQFEQTLIGVVRDIDGQGFFVEGFDVAIDEIAQQPAQGLLSGLVPHQRVEFLLEVSEGSQAMVLLREPCMQIVHISLFMRRKKLPVYIRGWFLTPRQFFRSPALERDGTAQHQASLRQPPNRKTLRGLRRAPACD
jgi:hypothetical protein